MVRKIASAVISISIKLIIAVLVVVLLVHTGGRAYEFGMEVFHPTPVSTAPGKDMIVIIEEEDSDMDVAKLLKSKGLISDEYVFFVQAKLYSADLYAGTYTLNTSMTSDEMLNIMITKPAA